MTYPMVLWFILTIMTFAAIATVCWPLFRRSKSLPSGSNLAVYSDQLDEIGRDEAASLIGKVEADAARIEVSRRLIAAAEVDATSIPAPAPALVFRYSTLAAAVLLIPLGAGAVYLSLGSPALVPVSLAADRGGAASQSPIEDTVAEVETFLQSNPRNGRGWELLAPVYLRLGRFGDAVKARRNALEIFGADAARLGDLGEAIVLASNGNVTAEAKELFERAATADPEDVMAQYYLGLSAKQDGNREEAQKRWNALVSSAREGAEWLPLVKNALARIDEKSPAPAIAPPEHAGGGIEAMVERLAERLKKDGSNVPGWIQLVRSYRVLGNADKVKTAIADARAAVANEKDGLQRLDVGLQGLESEVRSSVAVAAPSEPQPALPTAKPPGPSESDVAAAAQLGTAERNGMIEGMVARLANRMAENGSDVEGWLRLMRAYSVLGDRDKLQAAAVNARNAFVGNSDNLRRIDELAKELGLKAL